MDVAGIAIIQLRGMGSAACVIPIRRAARVVIVVGVGMMVGVEERG